MNILIFSMVFIRLNTNFVVNQSFPHRMRLPIMIFNAVELKGFEPLTLCLQSRCSNQTELKPHGKTERFLFQSFGFFLSETED